MFIGLIEHLFIELFVTVLFGLPAGVVFWLVCGATFNA